MTLSESTNIVGLPVIDRIVIGHGSTTGSGTSWTHGADFRAPNTPMSIQAKVKEALTASPDGYLLIHSVNYVLNEPQIKEAMRQPIVDVWYDERVSGAPWVPRVLQYLSPGIYFNLPESERGFTVWNLSLNCLLIKKDVLLQNAFLQPDFDTLVGATVEWVHRSIYCGVLFRNQDLIEGDAGATDQPTMTVKDELRIARYRFGKKWLLWMIIRYVLNGRLGIHKSLSAYRKVLRQSGNLDNHTRQHVAWRDHKLEQRKYKISIIIPTIERYPYIQKVLDQLHQQSIQPHEVIVIDQTPIKDRRTELFKGHEGIGLKYIQMDESGQCRSRNLGLKQSTGDYILFIDDDVEVKPDLLERHLKCLEYFNVDVSCGVCDESGAGPIPVQYNLIRHSDVLPTNNGMVRRKVLLKSGLFDMAFDHGQRADGDLGARIYKGGGRMILNPEIRVFHHKAPRGGLRKHNVRKVTYASSRQNVTHFRLPHVTELYLNKVHFTDMEFREYILLSLFGTMSVRGGAFKKTLKVIFAITMIPVVAYRLVKRKGKAETCLKLFPQIPQLGVID